MSATPAAAPAAPAAAGGDQQSAELKAPAKNPAAGEAPPPKDATAAEKKLWKLKAAGKEIDFDASDEEAVKRFVQKGLGADEAFQSAAQMRKQAEQFFTMLKDPKTLRQVLTDPRVGVDLKKFAEEYVWEQIQEQQLTPEQKRQRDVERELEKYKADEKSRKDKEDAEAANELRQKTAHDIDQRITAALKESGLPKTEATVKRMANYMLLAVRNGYDLEPKDLVEQVRRDYIEEAKALFGQTDGDMLLSLLGDDVGKKIRESDLKKLKSTTDSRFQTPAPKPGKAAQKPKKMDGAEWRESLKREFLGK